jgi:hypothetical protein
MAHLWWKKEEFMSVQCVCGTVTEHVVWNYAGVYDEPEMRWIEDWITPRCSCVVAERVRNVRMVDGELREWCAGCGEELARGDRVMQGFGGQALHVDCRAVWHTKLLSKTREEASQRGFGGCGNELPPKTELVTVQLGLFSN